MDSINELWNKVGLISKFSKEFELSTTQFGKTAVMKYLFILQEVFKVPFEYEFSLYTYGPYCADVLSDLDYSEAIDAVKLYNVCSGTGGYCIRPSTKTEEYISKSDSFLKDYDKEIKEVISLFGKMTARDLELRSTIIYMYKNYINNSWAISSDEIASDVNQIKPHFTNEEILSAYDQLEAMGIFKRIIN